MRDPQAALGVEGHAVGAAPLAVEFEEDLARTKRAIVVEREPIDQSQATVCVKQPLSVRADRRSVRDIITPVDPRDRAIDVDAVQGTGWPIAGSRHRPGPKAAVAIGLGVVHAVAFGLVRQVGEVSDLERLERQRLNAAREAGHEAAPVRAFDYPAHHFRHGPLIDPAIGKRQTVDAAPKYVDPVECPLAGRPGRPFPQ